MGFWWFGRKSAPADARPYVPAWRSQASIDAEAGRALPANDTIISDVTLALVELPNVMGSSSLNPTVHLAATAAASGWKRLPTQITCAGFSIGSRTAYRKAVMGHAVTALTEFAEFPSIDTSGSVEVEIIDPSQWLLSCDDEALDAGANLALIGDELIQFGNAEPIGPARFRLTRFLRGRFATDWAINSHVSGELFLVIDPSALQPIRLPPSTRDATVTASVQLADGLVSASRLVDGRSLPNGLFVQGEQVVGSRAAPIVDPAGGSVIDSEARSSLTQILGALRAHGLIET
jgi:hypothetical protein